MQRVLTTFRSLNYVFLQTFTICFGARKVCSFVCTSCLYEPASKLQDSLSLSSSTCGRSGLKTVDDSSQTIGMNDPLKKIECQVNLKANESCRILTHKKHKHYRPQWFVSSPCAASACDDGSMSKALTNCKSLQLRTVEGLSNKLNSHSMYPHNHKLLNDKNSPPVPLMSLVLHPPPIEILR